MRSHTQPQVEWGISQQRPDKVLPTHAVLSGGTASWASEVITWIFCLVLAKTQPSTVLPLLARGWQRLWLWQAAGCGRMFTCSLLRIQTPRRHRRHEEEEEGRECTWAVEGTEKMALHKQILYSRGDGNKQRCEFAAMKTIISPLTSFIFPHHLPV